MGRWGHRLFEADEDIRHVIGVAKDISQGDQCLFSCILGKALKTAPNPIVAFYQSEYGLFEDLREAMAPNGNPLAVLHYAMARPNLVIKLNAGLGSELLNKYIHEETTSDPLFPEDGKYRVIILAAVMMQFGATISREHLQHLRDIVPTIPCRETCASVFADNGFRGPGKRQFQMALEKYSSQQSPEPRDFEQPSCHACGKVAEDNDGKALTKCGRCKHPIAAAWFCNKDCRHSLWSVHKQGNCGEPRGAGTAVFQGHGKGHTIIGGYRGSMV